MAAASPEPSARGPMRRLGLLYLAIACLVVFVGAAWWSWRYTRLPDPFEPAESRTFWQWVTTPIEQNAFRRLPVITGDLHSVFALKGTEHVWAVGQGGLILHSVDGGESWEPQAEIDWNPTPPKQTEPAAQSDAFSVIRSARADGRAASLPPAEIAKVQRLLGDLGYDPGRADGQPRAKTRAAIEQFQRDAKLPVDGMLTKWVRDQLTKALDSRRRTNLPVSPAPDGNPGPVSGPGPDPNPGPGPLANPNPNPNPNLDPGSLGTPPPSPARNLLALRAVAFADERLGVAVGDNGVVLRTTDGGQHWQAVSSGTDAALLSVAFADARRVVAVGDNTVLRSQDGGKTWEKATTPAYASLSDVAFGPDGQAVAVGSAETGGIVLLSPDGGAPWVQTRVIASPALLPPLHAVAFGPDGLVVTVGASGIVLVSADSKTWSGVTRHRQESLSDVVRGAAGRWVAVGENGAVIFSVGAALAEQAKRPTSKVGLKSVTFGNAERALAVGQGGTVLLSTDGGERWEPKTSGIRTGLESVAFANAERALAVVVGGTVLLSTGGRELAAEDEWQRGTA